MVRAGQSVAAVIAILAAIACGGSTDPIEQRFAGDWTAVSVGGAPLPANTLVFASSGTAWRTYKRWLSIERGFSLYTDSLFEVRTSTGERVTDLQKFGSVTWTANDTVLTVSRDNSCALSFCNLLMFNQAFYLQRDGSLTARLDASDGPITVFHRQ